MFFNTRPRKRMIVSLGHPAADFTCGFPLYEAFTHGVSVPSLFIYLFNVLYLFFVVVTEC